MMVKFAKVPIKDIRNFMELRKQNDAINKAITKAKSYGISDSECQTLILKKLKIAQDFKEQKEKLIRACIDTNLIDLENNWYGVLCGINRKNELIVHPLVSNCLESIQIDFTNTRLKDRDEFDSILKNNTDLNAIEVYRNDILRLRDAMLYEFFDCTDSIEKDGETFRITSHCMRRWNERIRHAKEKVQIDTHEEVVNEITQAFVNSNFAYQADDENSRFFVNRENGIFFVVSVDNVIMTLWKNDFGFTNDEINRIATLMQLDNVIKYRQEYNEYKDSQAETLSQLENDKAVCKNAINDIDNQIARLIEEKNDIRMNEKNINQQISDIKASINEKHVDLLREENYILKAYKFVLSNE